ncbi:MAG TPA: 4-hydroxy-tetrahydrodipicolinate reductase [Thermoclostridium sp.]|nr:4-hydroxy-tetrahydrodipicolinate reductase [Thermoclostridium sp.]
MLKILLSGCNGTMGQVIKNFIAEHREIKIIAGFDQDPKRHNNNFPVYSDIHLCQEDADVIIDFSHFSAFENITNYAKQRKLPLVMATTGLNEENENQLRQLSKEIPVFRTANMSLGVNVIMDLIRRASKTLADTFDIEIIEKHHNKKVDAPSGTALMLAQCIDQALEGETNFIYGRHTKQDHRDKKDIGIHAVRGGTIVGEHSILYAGIDELIEIKHTAFSKNVFAGGAIKAAKYIASKENGYYTMEDILAKN